MQPQLVTIAAGSVRLKGILAIPDKASGIVLFAHGSGSSRLSPRNNFVAEELQKAKIATLLFDLLTEKEDAVYANRFNIDILTERLLSATKWIQKQPRTKKLRIGYFGASTGSAAALQAAAKLGKTIHAAVSRGGRPDLAEPFLEKVKSPTLLIVGGNDEAVIELNKLAYEKLQTEKKLAVIPAATHLFEEPGALEEAARLASEWFQKYL